MSRKSRIYPIDTAFRTPRSWFLISIIAIFLSLAACTMAPYRRPQQSFPAGSLTPDNPLYPVLFANAGLTTHKGVGRIEWTDPGGAVQNTRVAWICRLPDKLRVELMDITGRPAVSLSSDGRNYYLLSRPDRQYEKALAEDVDLAPFVSLPIDAAEVTRLIAGRYLPPDAHDAALTLIETESGPVILAETGWLEETRKFYLDESAAAIYKIEVFAPLGGLRYRATLSSFDIVGQNRIPARIELSDDAGARVRLRIDRFWGNIEAPDAAFVIEPPDWQKRVSDR